MTTALAADSTPRPRVVDIDTRLADGEAQIAALDWGSSPVVGSSRNRIFGL